MKRFFSALIASIMSFNFALAAPITNIAQAVELVERSIIKNQLSPLPLDCIMFTEMHTESHSPNYQIDVRENHNSQCGGDPNTAPRLFSYLVNKITGRLQTDAIWLEGHDEFSGEFYPIDPVVNKQKSGEKLIYFIKRSNKQIN
ncbi:hypothetical protein ACLS0M_09405 [Avibacterium avium]|uniref:hypothetical protein n=1 Tax=Avibacterium avium TaxID=751 RepID=UPI003BF77EC3